jgi:cobalamin synthase
MTTMAETLERPAGPPATRPHDRVFWPAFVDAARYLLTFDPTRAMGDARRARAAAAWIVPISLFIGLAWAGTFRATWRLYGEVVGIPIIPALCVILVEAFLTGRYLPLALARVVDIIDAGRTAVPGSGEFVPPRIDDLSSPPRLRGTLMLILIVLAQFVLLASLRNYNPWWPPEDDWRHYFNFLYPNPIYRPLLLAPLWGRWAILLAATIGRTAEHADPGTVALCRSMTPGRLLRLGVLPLLLSCVYFSREQNFLIGAVIGLAVFAISFVACVLMARRLGGQSRTTLLATGQVAQIAFLAAYRAMWGQIYL